MKTFMLAGFVLFYVAHAGLAGSALAWEMLGEKKVDFGNDRDRIEVGRKEGTFNELQVRVKDAPVEIHSMVVTFGNGKQFEPNLRERFRANTSSRAIELPGKLKRNIKSISFRYESIKMTDDQKPGEIHRDHRSDRGDRDDRSKQTGGGDRSNQSNRSDRGYRSDRDRKDRGDRQNRKADEGQKARKATVQVWGR